MNSKTLTKSTAASSGNPVPIEVEYYRINMAAEMLGCTADELLTMAAQGDLSVVAPVLARGRFMWPTDMYRQYLIGMDASVVCEFGPADRVTLTASTLREIEALGSAVPIRFFAPDIARKAFSNATRGAALLAEGAETERNITPNIPSVDQDQTNPLDGQADLGNANEVPSIFAPFYQDQHREAAINGVWEAIDEPEDNALKTTIDHLFISVSEIQRLREGKPLPQDAAMRLAADSAAAEKKPHGNTEANSKKQLEVLKFGLWLHRDEIRKIVGDATKWAAFIDDQARKRWPEEGEPPLQRSVIEKHLRSIFQKDPPN